MRENEEPKLICPLVHLNGTSGRDLLAQFAGAMDTLQDAIAAIPHPNGRDYYPISPTAIDAAIEQRNRWARTIEAVRIEVESIAMAINETITR